jgi:hypothetical protein
MGIRTDSAVRYPARRVLPMHSGVEVDRKPALLGSQTSFQTGIFESVAYKPGADSTGAPCRLGSGDIYPK